MRSCLDYAQDYIYRFPKTEKELRIQLIKKWYAENDIERTISELAKRGYVNDELFARLYIQSELIHKGKPSSVIIQKLLFKGVSKEMIQKLMDELNQEVIQWMGTKMQKEIHKLKQKGLEWVAIIQKLLSKWYKLSEIKEHLKRNS